MMAARVQRQGSFFLFCLRRANSQRNRDFLQIFDSSTGSGGKKNVSIGRHVPFAPWLRIAQWNNGADEIDRFATLRVLLLEPLDLLAKKHSGPRILEALTIA